MSSQAPIISLPASSSLRADLARKVELVRLLVQRDLRVRYRGSVLGYVWSMMNPLAYMLILSFVFSHLMKFDLKNYPMFILSGVLGWNLFAQSLSIGANSIVANGALLRKVRVPATIFPAASVCSCGVNFALALVPFVVVGIVTGQPFSPWLLTVPLVLIPFVAFIFGLALLVASLNVSFRDVGHTMEPILQIGYFASPVLYPMDSLPEKFQKILWLNPMVHFLTELRKPLYYGTAPSPTSLLLLFGIAAASLAIGGTVYRRMRNGFVYNV